ncbi:MAG: hypothetical protein CL920_26715 [Deltaproteobacteria bacterium]|nr:hypothetical protein [Deltaproteobacteria bacterium]
MTLTWMLVCQTIPHKRHSLDDKPDAGKMIQYETITQAVQGDRASCERLARASLPVLYRYFVGAWKLSGEEAEELAQDTFMEVWSCLHRFEGKAWRSWLLTIARRVAWKKLKGKPPEKYVSDTMEEDVLGQIASDSPSQEERLVEADQFAILRELLPQLRPEYQEILHFHYMEELSTQELAMTMDIPKGTAKTWLQRARAELKEKWLQRMRTQQARSRV